MHWVLLPPGFSFGRPKPVFPGVSGKKREKLVKTGKKHFWTGKTVQNVLDSGKSVINWSFIKVLLMFGGGDENKR